jgi:hypothetical protein
LSPTNRSPPPTSSRTIRRRASRNYFLIGLVALIAAAGLIGWHFFGERGEVLKPDGGPVVTVMDFGQPFPLHSELSI